MENKSNKAEYDSQEDIENQILLPVHQFSTTIDITESSEILRPESSKRFVNKTHDLSVNSLRVLNSISIIILLTTFIVILASKIKHTGNEFVIFEQVTSSSIKSEAQFLVLYIAFFFVASKFKL